MSRTFDRGKAVEQKEIRNMEDLNKLDRLINQDGTRGKGQVHSVNSEKIWIVQ